MIGFIRASFRVFRNRRVMLGSFFVLILTYVTHLILYSQIPRFDNPSCFWPILIMLSGMFWPALWGCVIAGTSPRDEMRQGTLEFLLATPITPKRLIIGMSFVPLMIIIILCFASIPSILLCLLRLGENILWIPPIITFLIMLPLIWFLIILSVWGGSKLDEYQNVIPVAMIPVLFFFVFVGMLTLFIWGNIDIPVLSYFLIAYGLANLVNPVVTLIRSRSFAIEDLEKQRDPNAKTISRFFAFMRRDEGTIFSRDEGVSKYMTLEMVRQQAIGGPFINRQTTRDIIIVALFLLSPIVLIVFMKHEPGMYSVLGIPFVIVMVFCAIYAATNAMSAMLNERASLRLDSMRITLIPLTEITDTKEGVAAMLPTIVLKWIMLFFILWMIIADFFQPLSVLVVTLCFMVQAWMALNLSARLGLFFGFHSSDELEGNLWVCSSLFVWLGTPYILQFLTRDSSNVLIPYIASLSPIHALLSISSQPLDIFTIMPFVVGLVLQYAIFILIARLNQNKMRYAWR